MRVKPEKNLHRGDCPGKMRHGLDIQTMRVNDLHAVHIDTQIKIIWYAEVLYFRSEFLFLPNAPRPQSNFK